MRKLLFVLILFSMQASVFAQIPVRTRNLDDFSVRHRHAVDGIWQKLNAPNIPGEQAVEFNPAECRKFRDYTHSLLRHMIQSSGLESSTLDLFLDVDCYNLHNKPLGAKLVSRTLVIDQGYFGGLESEDSLVALLAHELSHHILRHEDIVQPYMPKKPRQQSGDIFSSGQEPSISLNPFDWYAMYREDKLIEKMRENENEADITSVAIIANAGYSIVGALDLLNRTEAATFIREDDRHASFDERRQFILQETARLNLKELPQRAFPQSIEAAIRSYYNSEATEAYSRGSRRFKVISETLRCRPTLAVCP